MKPPPTTEATPFDDGALYDLVCGGIDFDLDFYLGLAKAARGLVLEVCCGTGRVLLPCLQTGADAEGLDMFPPMLVRLREKAAALGFNPVLHETNMAGFQLARRRICALADPRRFRWPSALARNGCDDRAGVDRSW